MRVRPFLARELSLRLTLIGRTSHWTDACARGSKLLCREKAAAASASLSNTNKKTSKKNQGALNAVIKESSLHFRKSHPPIEHCSGNTFLPGPGSHTGPTCS